MKRKILIVVTGDPRTSPRTAEAVRIAAGVGTWERTEISIYLRGEAIRAAGAEEDDCARYWPMLAEAKEAVFVQKGAAALRDLGEPAVSYIEISDEQLADLAAEQSCVLRF